MNLTMVGDIFTTYASGTCEVIEYRGATEVLVRFILTGYKRTTTTRDLKAGNVKDPYFPRVSGVGFLGEGEYKSSYCNSKVSPDYYIWTQMLKRCYDTKNTHLHPRYGNRGITVCKEWHNFQEFAEWYSLNFKPDGHLDKDLRKPGSMLYSPENCEFVPRRINNLLTSRPVLRGEHPVGVRLRGNTFLAQCMDNTKKISLGSFRSAEDAFFAYKTRKESIIKSAAEEYYSIGGISEEVYNTLMNWEVIPYPE